MYVSQSLDKVELTGAAGLEVIIGAWVTWVYGSVGVWAYMSVCVCVSVSKLHEMAYVKTQSVDTFLFNNPRLLRHIFLY